MEVADDDVEGIANSQNYHLRVVLAVHWRAIRKVCLINPHLVLHDALALEPLELQTDIECEFHQLVRTSRNTSDVLQVLPEESVS